MPLNIVITFWHRETTGMNRSTFTALDDPFVVLETTSTTMKSTSIDPLEEFSKFNHSGSTKPPGSTNASPLRPPPRPGQVLKSNKGYSAFLSTNNGLICKCSFSYSFHNLNTSPMLHDAVKGSNVASIDELEDFAMGRVQNNAGRSIHHAREVSERQPAKATKYKEAEVAAWKNHEKSANDLESFFSMGFRSNSVPRSRTATVVRKLI